MSRSWLRSLLCLSAAVVFVQLSAANSELRVNASAAGFLIQNQTIVSLAVSNSTPQRLPSHLKLELLGPVYLWACTGGVEFDFKDVCAPQSHRERCTQKTST